MGENLTTKITSVVPGAKHLKRPGDHSRLASTMAALVLAGILTAVKLTAGLEDKYFLIGLGLALALFDYRIVGSLIKAAKGVKVPGGDA